MPIIAILTSIDDELGFVGESNVQVQLLGPCCWSEGWLGKTERKRPVENTDHLTYITT